MTFFKLFIRALAAALGAGAVVAAPEVARVLIGFFTSGPVPSDLSFPMWTTIGTIFIFLINLALSFVRARARTQA